MINSNAHTIVIGAGASGLLSAIELLRKGHHVTIIEGRDRTGGRIHTHAEGFTFPVELGAEFIHGNQELTQQILNAAKLPTRPVTGDFVNWSKGQAIQETDDPEWNAMLEKLGTVTADETLADFLEHHFDRKRYHLLYERVTDFVEGYDAADINKVSALALREEWRNSNDETQFRVVGGYGAMIDYLERQVWQLGGTIQLARPVRTIRWQPGSLTVVSADGMEWEASRVVITVPLGVLQQKRIRFEPALADEYREAFHDIGYGSVTKYLFEFKPAFWEQVVKARRKNLAFYFSDAEVPTWWTQSPENSPLLTGWQGGPSVAQGTRDNEQELIKAVRSLSYLLGCSENAIEVNIIHYRIINWTDDPFSCGAYAYSMVGSSRARQVLNSPVSETLFFAGEALYDGPAIGTVEAALQSAKAVAAKIS